VNGLLAHLDLTRGLLALLLSFALFGVVQGERNPPETGSFEAPLDIVNRPPGLVEVGNPSATVVQVRISAPRENWSSMRSAAVRAYIDLRNAFLGEHEYPVIVDLPDTRVRVLETIPSRVTLHLDERLDRSVPVRLLRSGTVAFGYVLGEPVIEPRTVDVVGAMSIVNQIDSATVELRLDGVTSEIDGRYTVGLADASGEGVSLEARGLSVTPAAVRVRIPVTQEVSHKIVGVQPDLAGSLQSGYVVQGVTVDPSSVTIAGAPRAVSAVTFASTERIDLTGLSSTVTRQVTLAVPEGVSILQQEVARVTVNVSPLVLTQSFPSVPVPEGLSEGLQVVSSIPSVQVVFQGPASMLRAFGAGDFHATVDLQGLSAGTHSAAVTVEAPPGVTVQSVNPRVIAITISESAPGAAAGYREPA
jgi:YbbR domain-containing protein